MSDTDEVSSRAESLEGSWVSQDQEVLGELKGEPGIQGWGSRFWVFD